MKTINFDLLSLYAPARFQVPPPPVYIHSFNAEYYPQKLKGP